MNPATKACERQRYLVHHRSQWEMKVLTDLSQIRDGTSSNERIRIFACT